MSVCFCFEHLFLKAANYIISPLKYAFIASHITLLDTSGVLLILKKVLICAEMWERKLSSESSNGSSLQCLLVYSASGKANARARGAWSEIIISLYLYIIYYL